MLLLGPACWVRILWGLYLPEICILNNFSWDIIPDGIIHSWGRGQILWEQGWGFVKGEWKLSGQEDAQETEREAELWGLRANWAVEHTLGKTRWKACWLGPSPQPHPLCGKCYIWPRCLSTSHNTVTPSSYTHSISKVWKAPIPPPQVGWKPEMGPGPVQFCPCHTF